MKRTDRKSRRMGTVDEFLTAVESNTPQPPSGKVEDDNAGEAQASSEKFEYDDENELVAAINAKCSVVQLGNEKRFVMRDEKTRLFIFMKRPSAEIEFAQYKLHRKRADGKPCSPVSGFKVWLEAADRKDYKRIVFNPKAGSEDPDELNLFGGFAIDPAPGDWSLMKAHLFENVCQRNQEHYDYLLMWMSQMFCEPERKSGICPVLRGPEGVGKSIVGVTLRTIVGKRHSLTIDKPEHVAGKFNSAIEQAIFVLVEEALFAGDPQKRNAFAHLITNHSLTYERKGIDAADGENYSRFMIVSNEDWVAPVSARDRRYFVLEVGDAHKEDKPYFAAIEDQLIDGGYAAMLHDLLAMNVKMRDLPKPPMTEAKREQVALGMKPDVEWLGSVLGDGQFSFLDEDREPVEWPEKGGEIAKDDIAASFRDFVPGFRGRPATSNKVGRFLGKWIQDIATTRPTVGNWRPWHYKLPPLEVARTAFLAAHPEFEFPAEKPDDSEATAKSDVAEEAASSPVTGAKVAGHIGPSSVVASFEDHRNSKQRAAR
jgi:hypothetical protein